MSVETAVADFNEAFAKAKNEVKDKVEAEVREILADDHEDHSYSYIGWTPGFNDGDPCEHTSGIDYDWVANGDFEIHDGKQWNNNNNKISKLFRSIPTVIEQAIWDTDFRLIITKNGIQKDWYECGY